MGQKDKAAQLAEAAGFSVNTTANDAEIHSVIEGAAASAATGGMKGSFRRLKQVDSVDGFDELWELRGPGGAAQVFSLIITVRPAGPTSRVVTATLRDYKWQKGVAFTAPTLNGHKQMAAFKDSVTRHLTSAS